MTDGAAPASADAPSTAPAAEGKPALSIVKADEGKAPESQDATARAKRRSGKRHDERKRANIEEQKAAAIAAASKKPADDAEPEGEADTEVAETKEQRESWAAKLRQEHETATKKVAALEAAQRKAASEWQSAYAAAKDEIDDAKADGAHYKGLFDRLVAGLKSAGYEVDPLEIQMAEHQRELARYKARDERSKKAGDVAKVRELAGSIEQRVRAVITKYPDLDPKKNQEAAQYMRWRLTADPRNYPLDSLERDLEAFARHQRATLGAKAAPQASATSAPQQRPQSSTLGDAARAAPPATRKESSEPKSDKQFKEEFKRRKVLRLANG